MTVARRPDELPAARRSVAIGTFDGVHRGHRRVLEAAEAAHLRPAVVTFDPHPRMVLGGGVQLLTTTERRLELLAEAGVEDVLVLRFDEALAGLDPEEFAETALRAIGAEVVAAGETFRFGRGRSGDLDLLERMGFDVRRVPLVENVSSSHMRQLLAIGDVVDAAALLGRPPEVDGTVVRGERRGGGLGFPTANLALRPVSCCPADGVYAGEALGRRAAISIGTNPAFRRRGAPRRGPSARLRRGPVRLAARRLALGAAARAGGVRLRGGARRGDRRRRRAHRTSAPPL